MQVLKQLKWLEHLPGIRPLQIPEQNIEQLKGLINMGACSYLNVDLPRGHDSTNTTDLSQNNAWKREIVAQFAFKKVWPAPYNIREESTTSEHLLRAQRFEHYERSHHMNTLMSAQCSASHM